MKYTIKDVAEKSGVSIATVSRVLNNKDRVKEETRLKILDAIQELDFITNSSAKNLRGSKSNTLGVLVPDLSAAFYSEIIKGIENKANELGYRLIVCDAQNNVVRERDYLKLLYDESVDGMILLVTHLIDEEIKKITEDNHSIVIFGRDTECLNVPSITVDNVSGALDAMQHLYVHGYRRIAYIGGNKTAIDHIERLKGYKLGCEKYGLAIEDSLIENGDFTEFGGGNAFVRLMASENPPDAIFCANDEMVLGILKASRKMGIKIPKDIAVIGFDNINICQYTYPTITTINQPKYNIGVLLCEKLIFAFNNKETSIKNTNLVLRPELVIRESCGC